jgi:hypothetical protein
MTATANVKEKQDEPSSHYLRRRHRRGRRPYRSCRRSGVHAPGEQIPVDQVDNIKEACEGLRAANTASLTTSDDQVDPTETGSTGTDDSLQTSSPDPASQDKWDELMATLSVEECETAGFFIE